MIHIEKIKGKDSYNVEVDVKDYESLIEELSGIMWSVCQEISDTTVIDLVKDIIHALEENNYDTGMSAIEERIKEWLEDGIQTECDEEEMGSRGITEGISEPLGKTRKSYRRSVH